MTSEHLSHLVAHFGYVANFVAILVASAGIPLPAGELLIAAAIYAANTHRLSLPILILVGSSGALIGGVMGYAMGRVLGAAALERYGRFVGLNAAKVRLGRYLFQVQRFVALVGPFGGVLAGANKMMIGRFMIFNALGAVAWNIVFGAGGYLFGAMFEAVGRTAGIAAVAVTLALLAAVGLYIHRRGAELQAKADAMLGAEVT
jgi:membrane protein DedA with SNARE-associated domain